MEADFIEDLDTRIQNGINTLSALIRQADSDEERDRLTGKRGVLGECLAALRANPSRGTNQVRALLNMIEASPLEAAGRKDGASLVRDYLRAYPENSGS